jgi:Zn finger protein HypA/HybF involved in hydrogenase expression
MRGSRCRLLDMDITNRTATTTPTQIRVALVCLECGKKWKVSPTADPQCPKCNGVDYDVLGV